MTDNHRSMTENHRSMTDNTEAEGCRTGDAGGGSAVAGTVGKLLMTAAPFIALLALLLVHRCLSA